MNDPREPIFAAIRAATDGNPFNVPGRIEQLHTLLDGWGVRRAVAVPEAMRTSQAGIDLIHSFEGLARVRPDGRIEAYPDPGTGGEPWTIGWGSTGTDPFNGGRIRKGTIWTRAQADERFRQHLAEFEQEVRDALGDAPVTQNQFDALVSLAYNIGRAAFRKSTLVRKHRAGDYAGAAREFLRWNRAGGKVMRGLTRRREAEARMYRGQS
jgi:GH24 family phage-related lysozyme (muramidase)